MGKVVGSVIRELMRRTWQLPDGVPSDQRKFLSAREFCSLKWIFKYLKRRVLCFLFVEHCGLTAEKKSISNQDKDILWINLAASSLGDSLMDLAARVMLSDRQITLLTHPKNEALYKEDRYFHAVYSDPHLLTQKRSRRSFDLVICDSFSPRVLIHKLRLAPFVSFVGLYGYLNGFEVHRTQYSFMRMKELLGVDTLRFPVRPTIAYSSQHSDDVMFDVCIAVGGEWEFRKYVHWLEVVESILKLNLSVTLVGSSNGAPLASQICSRFPQVHSTVGLLSLQDVANWIARTQYFIGADGGLWHIACSISIPTVVLFADCELFDDAGNRVTRETEDMECEPLYHEAEVSQISPTDVLDAFERLRSKYRATKQFGLAAIEIRT